MDISKTSKLTIAKTVLFAGIAGIFLTCVLATPIDIISKILDEWSWRSPVDPLPAILKGMLSGVLAFPIIALLASPIIAVAIGAAIILRKRIEWFFTLFCGVAVVGMAMAMRSVAEDDRIAGDKEPFSITITGGDILACLIGALFFLITFYNMTAEYAVKERDSAPPKPRHQNDQ